MEKSFCHVGSTLLPVYYRIKRINPKRALMHNVHCLASAAFSNAFLNAPNFSEMENCFQNQGEVGKFVKFKTKKLIVLIGIKTYLHAKTTQ